MAKEVRQGLSSFGSCGNERCVGGASWFMLSKSIYNAHILLQKSGPEFPPAPKRQAKKEFADDRIDKPIIGPPFCFG
jgi:hypothetical protein